MYATANQFTPIGAEVETLLRDNGYELPYYSVGDGCSSFNFLAPTKEIADEIIDHIVALEKLFEQAEHDLPVRKSRSTYDGISMVVGRPAPFESDPTICAWPTQTIYHVIGSTYKYSSLNMIDGCAVPVTNIECKYDVLEETYTMTAYDKAHSIRSKLTEGDQSSANAESPDSGNSEAPVRSAANACEAMGMDVD